MTKQMKQFQRGSECCVMTFIIWKLKKQLIVLTGLCESSFDELRASLRCGNLLKYFLTDFPPPNKTKTSLQGNVGVISSAVTAVRTWKFKWNREVPEKKKTDGFERKLNFFAINGAKQILIGN